MIRGKVNLIYLTTLMIKQVPNSKFLIPGLIGLVLIVVMAIVVIAGTRGPAASTDIVVVSSITPLSMIANEVTTGQNVETVTLLPSGASPHTFEPTAQDQAQLADADVLFVVGAEFDDWALAAAEAVNPDLEIVDLSQDPGVLLLEGEVHGHDEEDHKGEDEDDDHSDEEKEDTEHGEYDPHYWLSLDNASAIGRIMAQKLSELDEGNNVDYTANASNFASELDLLSFELEDEFAELDGREIITFHGAFNYLAADLGVEVVATVEEFPGDQPSASYIAEVGEKITEYGVTTLFKEPQLSDAIVQPLADDYGASVETLDPLGGVDGRTTYLELIRYNADTIKQSLS